MQVTQTQSNGLTYGFTVVLPSADLEARRSARLNDLARTAKLPGFRPGKVPVKLMQQRYGAAVNGEILEKLINESMTELLKERDLRPAVAPKVDVVSGAEGEGDLTFTLEVEVLPQIDIPDISGVALTRLTSKPTDETIEKALASVAQQHRQLEVVAQDRPLANGDVATVDFVGKVDGVAFEGGTANDINVEIGGSGFIPGFAEQLEGMKAGEEKVISVTFPEKYHAEALAGKDASFEIRLKEIKAPLIPEIDDALAKKAGFEDSAKLREAIVKQVEQEYSQLSRMRIKRDLLDVLAERINFDAPPSMVDTEFDQIWQRVEQERARGELEDDDKEKDEETLRTDYRKIAERRVRLGLLVAEIGRVKEIAVSQGELLTAIRQEASRFPGQEKAVFEYFAKHREGVDSLRGPILENKVIDYLLELAEVKEEEVTPEQLADVPEVAL